MIVDARRRPDGEDLDADVVVVGAGPAGITLGLAFAGSGAKVVILESGGHEIDGPTQELYDGVSDAALPYFDLNVCRLRFFGGATNHWGGVCRPMSEDDFEVKSWIPNSGWPLRRRSLDRWYEQAQDLLGLRQRRYDTAFWAEHDAHPALLDDTDAFDGRIAQIIAKADRRVGKRQRKALERARDVTVLLHANVVEIDLDDAGRTATGVQVATLTGKRFRVLGRAVVLATGGLENPRLLLTSRSRLPQGIGNGHDQVGRYFMDHPRFVAGELVPTGSPNALFYSHHRSKKGRLQGYLTIAPEVLEREALVDVAIRMRSDYEDAFDDALDSNVVEALRALVKRTGGRDLGEDVASLVDDVTTAQTFLLPGSPLPLPHPDVIRRFLGATKREREALLPSLGGSLAAFGYNELTGQGPLRRIQLTTRLDPVPNPDSRVVLGDDRDALGLPRLRLEWRLTEQDRRSARRSLELLATEAGRTGLGRVRITLPDDGWPDDLAGGFHHIGTTRMSDDPKRGVVDADLRVHGTTNVFVAGSSVFPTAGTGTPTMLIIALAYRLADHLQREVLR